MHRLVWSGVIIAVVIVARQVTFGNYAMRHILGIARAEEKAR